MTTPTMAHRLAAEFIGTFWLVLGGCGSAVFAAKFTSAMERRWESDSSVSHWHSASPCSPAFTRSERYPGVISTRGDAGRSDRPPRRVEGPAPYWIARWSVASWPAW